MLAPIFAIQPLVLNNNKISESLFVSFSLGDKGSFTVIYYHYQQVVFNNILKLIAQEHVAEDILQDVFFKLWENKSKLNSEQAVAAWLFTVSYNESINYIRRVIKEKKYIQFSLTEKVQEFIQQTTEVELQNQLRETIIIDAINQLPIRKKTAFELCKLQGKSYVEAATIMGISPDTVKEHLSIAVKFIKSYTSLKYAEETFGTLSLFSVFLQCY